jgi:AraC family transcriptional regulator of adaptative response / DNA-3-methyladenine glycosylase II
MYARVLESDASCNGRFFTGVLTTGIYCIPACRARKPKPGNVKFFPSCEAARAAGLRPCKKCHPDDFARGADPVLEDIETLVAEIRANPAQFPDARAIVRRSGFGSTRLFELFRQHYHSTPADLLLRARIAAARSRLLTGDERLIAIASEVGFESLSVFHEHFRQLNGLTPASYRDLKSAREFSLTLPTGYPLGYLRRALSRDTQSVTERMEGDSYTAAIQLNDGPAILKLQLAPDKVLVSVEPATVAQSDYSLPNLTEHRAENKAHASRVAEPLPAPAERKPFRYAAMSSDATGSLATEAHAIVVGLIGLDQDAAAFSRLARKLGLARLVAHRAEMRIAQTPSVFDGLLWSIIGQQINFAFACVLKRRLIERAGTKLANGLYTPPTPAAVAALEPAELLPLQFSRSKADYVISTARLVANGALDLDRLRTMSATRAERTLLDIRGLGPWSVNYLMMRALGFPDCVPLGDTGVTSGLQDVLKLEERPDIDATRRLMTVFSPYRSLATAHLWQFNKPIPT